MNGKEQVLESPLHELCERELGSDPESEIRRVEIIAELVGARCKQSEPEAFPRKVVTNSLPAVGHVATVAIFSFAASEFADSTKREDI